MKMEAFILAGGASSRMGKDKAWLPICGTPMVQRASDLLWPLVEQVTLIATPNRFTELPLRVFEDDEAGLGPLGGIVTALRVSRGDWNLVIGCDLPFLTTDWLAFLLSRARLSGADVILPEGANGHVEPLCAMYHTSARPKIAEALAKGIRKVTEGLEALRIERILPVEWKPFDSRGLLFKNMNSPEDYAEARALLESESRDVWLKGPRT